MSAIDGLTFVKKAPSLTKVAAGHSPMDRARKKLLAEIDAQISLAKNPAFTIVTERKKRSGEVQRSERKPKSWVVVQDGAAYITVRFSNKPMPIGGKRGGVIKCGVDEVAATLTTVREWIASLAADGMIEKMMAAAKRKPRAKS